MTPGLEFVFRLRLDFGARVRLGPLPGGGARGFVPVVGGTIEGPRLTGEAVPLSGGDWPLFRPDGVVEFDARYLLRAADGTLISVHNRGFAHAPPEVAKRIEAGERVDPSLNYFRLSPVFEVPAGPHEWLARTVFVGTGDKHRDHSVFDYYAVL
ncbi:MAG: DUF3237 family protein [Deltaproteobacteria bacterium]|nr:DUF3237 family protein [Deltaproteobacteria bacterium]